MNEKKIIDMLNIDYIDIKKINTSFNYLSLPFNSDIKTINWNYTEGNYIYDAIVIPSNPKMTPDGEGNLNSFEICIRDLVNTSNCSSHLEDQIDLLETSTAQFRCERGKARLVNGIKICKKFIYTVGPISDANLNSWNKQPSSSCVDTLESCYKNIIRILFNNDDKTIKSIAIPIISTGNYNFDFELAFEVAIASVYNELLELKWENKEAFNYFSLEEIHFIILSNETDTNIIFLDKTSQPFISKKSMERYKECMKKEQLSVIRSAFKSQLQFIREIKLYDQRKGYFSFVYFIRKILLYIRLLGIVSIFKDITGRNWKTRRIVTEITSLAKLIFVLSLLYHIYINHFVPFKYDIYIIFYFIFDTITYLLSLIIHVDIQKPSANVNRSLILLLINYLEVTIEFSLIIYYYFNTIPISKILNFTFFNQYADNSIIASSLNLLIANSLIKFFFITLLLGYFSGHMRQRQFRTK